MDQNPLAASRRALLPPAQRSPAGVTLATSTLNTDAPKGHLCHLKEELCVPAEQRAPPVRVDPLRRRAHGGAPEAVVGWKCFFLLSPRRVYSSVCASSRKEAARAGPALPAAEILAGSRLLGFIFSQTSAERFQVCSLVEPHIFPPYYFSPLSGA